MLLSKIFSGTLVLLLAPLATAVPLAGEAKIVPRSENRIYVGNIPFTTTKEGLSDLFARSGHVVDANIAVDRE
jgi:RNA recognition motif-containing protein